MTKRLTSILTRQRRLLKAQGRIESMYALREMDIVALSELEEMSAREIARLYKMTRQRVEQILKRAKSK